ncbi:pilus assembly protein PilM [Neobacillus sp. PS3-40]|uniref:type IV pilus biogenesis protein PilM n=1 Tax=Neobacillus sp. PS3-40 TaxID=3070679 RepID=UPI0027E19141|nr:pilus assembly protein PilM [Neobacillus sp. PS3-40]WML45551.1 pilus assembly protein PilM [Neobacillus sp. PS3-40]
MSFSLFSPKNRIINFVLNEHSIRFVELKQANPPIAQKWGERFLPPGIISDGKIIDFESLANIIDECIDEWKIHKRSIRFLVPDSLVIIRKLSIPSEIQADEMKGFLYLELGTSIHLPFEDPVFDTFPLTDNGKTKEILLFAAPEKYVMEYADLFTSLKLIPVAADISPLALYRLYFQMDLASQNENLFIVQFDLTSVTMCIFEEAIPYVMRHFPIPFEINKWEMNKEKDGMLEFKYMGDASELAYQFEDILKEMNKLIDFYRYSLNNGKKEVTKLLLSGDHPLLQVILEKVKDRLDIPVTTISLDSYAKGKAGMVPTRHLLSLGLALKEVQ